MMESDLSRRNVQSLSCALQDMHVMLYQQEQRITAMQVGLSALAERFIALERLLLSEKVAHTGHGPTVQE